MRAGLPPHEALEIDAKRKAKRRAGEVGHREGVDYRFLPDAF